MEALTVALADEPDILASGLNDINKNHKIKVQNKDQSKMF